MMSLERDPRGLLASGLLTISLGLAACAGEKPAETDTDTGTEPPAAQVSVDVRRSLMITDQDILKPFTFRRVMTALAGGGEGAAIKLFHQWWDTQNDASTAT